MQSAETPISYRIGKCVAVQRSPLHGALLEAGASEDAASRAAEEVAELGNRIARVEARIPVLTWLMGIMLVINIGVVAVMFGR